MYVPQMLMSPFKTQQNPCPCKSQPLISKYIHESPTQRILSSKRLQYLTSKRRMKTEVTRIIILTSPMDELLVKQWRGVARCRTTSIPDIEIEIRILTIPRIAREFHHDVFRKLGREAPAHGRGGEVAPGDAWVVADSDAVVVEDPEH